MKQSIDELYDNIVTERDELFPFLEMSPNQQTQEPRTHTLDSQASNFHDTSTNLQSKDLEFFTRVIDIDALTDTKEINKKLWIDQYYQITENLSADAPIHTIEVGETFSLVINSKNKVFTWGLEQNHLLGVKSSQVQGTFKQIQEEMGSTRLKSLVASDDHTLALDYNSNVYAWGDNDDGKLGVGVKDKIVYPVRLLTLPKEKIQSIAAKGKYNVALTHSGEVMIWPIIKKREGMEEKVINTPMLLALPCSSITKVACGYNFLMFVSSNGLLYSMGDNTYGQLGIGHRQNSEKPELVQWLKTKGEKCLAISCGFKHVVFLSGLGKIYTWGSGYFGQLGHGSCEDLSLPMLMPFNLEEYGIKISQVQAGMRASYAMTEDHRLLWWGTNGRLLKQDTPVEVKLFELVN